MANRYWVGGTDTWDATAGLKWALTSGGIGGQAVPTSSDTVFFDANSGANTVTLGANANCLTLTMTGFTGTLAFSTFKISIAGNNATVYVGATTFSTSGTKLLEFTYSGATGTRTISPAGSTEANAVNISVIAGTDIVSIGNNLASIDFTGFSGTFSNAAKTIYGNLTISTGMTLSAGTGIITFGATSGTKTITTNGKTLDFPVIFNGVGGIFQLQDAMTVGSTRTINLTSGTLDMNNKNLTCGIFSSSGTATRSITFGTAGIYVTGSSGTIFNIDTATSFTYTGSGNFYFTYSGSTGTRGIFFGALGASQTNVPNIYVNAGSDTVTLEAGRIYKTVDFTGFTGTLTNVSITLYGSLVLSTGMTVGSGANTVTFVGSLSNQITTNGQTLDFPITFGGTGGTWQLQDAMTVGSTRTITLTSGTLDMNNKNLTCGFFGTSNSNIRSIAFGTAQIYVTGNNGGIWTSGTATNFSYTGTGIINATYSGSVGTRSIGAGGTETNSLNFNITAGSDIVSISGTSKTYKSINLTGFSGTWSSDNWIYTIYGSLTIPATVTATSATSTYTGPITFGATSATNTITTSGLTIPVGVTFNGVGSTFQFQDALTIGSSFALTLINGTVQLKSGATNTVGSFATSGTNIKGLQASVAGSQATLSQASGTVSVSYLSIKDSAATGGAVWQAYTTNNNTDSGNNTGWDFGSIFVLGSDNNVRLRSFTQRGRD